MSLEHSPTRQGGSGGSQRSAFTINEFCEAHRICRASLYKAWAAGTGPRYFLVGGHRRISVEAAAEWRARSPEAA